MRKVYIPVSVKDELPDKNSVYFTDKGFCEYDTECNEFYTDLSVTIWFKEVMLPSDDEMLNAKHKMPGNPGFKEGANYLLNLLKAS